MKSDELNELLRSALDWWLKCEGPKTPLSAYDELTWQIVTANKEELEVIVRHIWDYDYIPIPLTVLICRLCAHELCAQGRISDEHLLYQAVGFIRGHCSQGEVIGALSGLYKQIKSLGYDPLQFAFDGWLETN